MDNLLAYVLIVAGVIWAANAFKQFMIQRALNSLDKQSSALSDERKVIQHEIDKSEHNLKNIASDEAKKSTKEAEDFWNIGKGS